GVVLVDGCGGGVLGTPAHGAGVPVGEGRGELAGDAVDARLPQPLLAVDCGLGRGACLVPGARGAGERLLGAGDLARGGQDRRGGGDLLGAALDGRPEVGRRAVLGLECRARGGALGERGRVGSALGVTRGDRLLCRGDRLVAWTERGLEGREATEV